MGIWIAENKYTRGQPVRGTSLLDDLHAKQPVGDHAHAADLKRDKNGVVLVPQPSDDPRDPLNWPRWKKEATYLNLLFCTALVGACGPLISPGFVQIAGVLDVSINEVAATNAALVLSLGCVMFFQSAAAIKYGRRPVYLAGTICLIAGTIWSAAAPGVNNLLGSRIIQGFGMAPTESIATATIADLFFVHQRGLRSAIWGLSLLAGINLGPLVNGFIINDLGYEFSFWVILPFYILSFIGQILAMPETAYDRPKQAAAPTAAAADMDKVSEKDVASHHEDMSSGGEKGETQYKPAKTVVQEMKPWSGYKNKDSIIKIFLRPFPLLLSPTVFYGFLTYGIATLLLVVVSVLNSYIFSSAYGFNSAQTGLVSLSPLIASIIMSLIAGYISDWLSVFMSRRNRGVFEPECRLLLMIPYVILVVLGYAGWAVSYEQQAHWFAPVFCYALVNAGQKFLSTAAVTLIIDTHREQTSEAQAVLNFLKNLISYFVAARINGWVISFGVANTFYVLAGISAGIASTTIPMYRYGKICRSWVERHQSLFLI